MIEINFVFVLAVIVSFIYMKIEMKLSEVIPQLITYYAPFM